MSDDGLRRLAEAGYVPENDAQRAVLESLTEAEVSTLISINSRIAAADSDVQGHSEDIGAWVW